jgi:hypothetical protein
MNYDQEIENLYHPENNLPNKDGEFEIEDNTEDEDIYNGDESWGDKLNW